MDFIKKIRLGLFENFEEKDITDFFNNFYDDLVMLCRDKKLNFDVSCGAKKNKEFILRLMGQPKQVKIENFEFYLGKKYQVLAYDSKNKEGKANFHNKLLWRFIEKKIGSRKVKEVL